MRNWFFGLGGLVALSVAPPAHAAGIDCTKARSTVEKAICANPNLLALDQSIAAAYADALARQPERQADMRQDLLRWLKQRDATCALPAAAVPRCLSTQMTQRLAALAPPPAAAAPSAAPTAAAPASPTPTPTPAGPLLTTPAATRPADPAIPSMRPPQAAATLDQSGQPAAEHGETFLRVTSPGRFTVAAKSASGASLQLVDLMTGPGEEAGEPGAKDGRIDPLLDVGTYKLRVRSAKGATGAVALSVVAFHDAVPPAALPPPGFPLSAALRDGQQRAFWLTVPPDGLVRIEAAGRALADLRLFRDGRELSALSPDFSRVEPAIGHPLTDARLIGKVEPGTYLAIAYGGASLPWTDNDASQPFHLRAGASPALGEGWAGGPMGPFGSEVFAVPPASGLLRLSLPASAAASLLAGGQQEDVTVKSREPIASLWIAPGKMPIVEVRAAAGQAFTVRALETPPGAIWSKPGTFWVSAVANGFGGDEAPPAALLERTEFDASFGRKPPRIVASTVPQVGAGVGWHTRFNLRGPTRLPIEASSPGYVTIRTGGVAVKEGVQSGAYDVPTGYYAITLTPVDGAFGSLDLTVGPPDAPAPPVASLPADPVVPLGLQTVGPGQTLRLSGTEAPNLGIALSARAVPVALAEGPLIVSVPASAPVSVPIRIVPGGTLAVTELGAGPVGYSLQGDTVTVPPADHARSVVLAWRQIAGPAAAIAEPPPPEAGARLDAQKPVAFDLDRDATKSFALTVPDGGLYRVETTGRLRTEGRIASAFAPSLNDASANGVGENMLLQQILRAGRYRVSVTARDSDGHLGLVASPAPVLAGGTLLPGGSVRASLPAGSAAAFPITVAGPNERYRLEVASIGAPWPGRIEDAGGWPLAATAPLDGQTPALSAGDYRLAVSPDAVARRIVARLSAIPPEMAITGQGPHALPFAARQAATWREPDGRDQPRAPDVWTFSLAGPAEVTLQLSDGMAGDLRRAGDPATLDRIVGRLDKTLPAGSYRLEATSLGRNDRLAYTVALDSKQAQPGVPRAVTLPASVPFAIADERVVSLTTFGSVPVKGVLRRADGSVVARYGARADDWNVAASRRLPAGAYTLDLAAATPPDVTTVSRYLPNGDESEGGDRPEGGDKADGEQEAQAAPTPPGDAEVTPTPAADDSPGDETAVRTEITLSLPATLPTISAPSRAEMLTGAGVHALDVPSPAPGGLVTAQATSSAALVLALERKSGEGWRTVALDEGTAPVVASPADTDPAAWRVEAWTVDGGSEPIRAFARAVAADAQPAGSVSLAAIDGAAAPLAVARIGLDAATPVSVGGEKEVLVGGWAGQALAVANGPALPEGRDLWLLARGAPRSASVSPLDWGSARALVVPVGQTARLPAIPSDVGKMSIWRADGGFGQPGLGGAAGIARGGAIALAERPAVLRDGPGDHELRVSLARLSLARLPARPLDVAMQVTLPPKSALPVTLPAGDKLVQLDAGAGVGIFAEGTAAWSGDAPLTRTMTGDWTALTLVNAGSAPAPASLAWQPMPAVAALKPGGLEKRFFGAAGSFERAFDAVPGARLAVAGDATLTVIAADGAVRRGTEVAVAGAGRVIVEHGTGPIALWEIADAASPWPEATPQAVQTPARVTLAGPAMALSLDQSAATLLHVSTTAPVIVAFSQPGRADPPRLFPAGAEMTVFAGAGAAELRLYSPTDGPLTGTLALSADPVTAIGEGLGAPVAIAPGGGAAFAFQLAKAATIGVGVRAVPDRATVRLLDVTGAVRGEGVAQLASLPAGRYVIEARVPPDAPPTTLAPAVVGITPRGNGPPPEVARTYLELVGLKPKDAPP